MKMLKKTALAALIGLAASLTAPAHAFVITAGTYKITVDGYVNGTVYALGAGGSCGGINASAANIALCDAAPSIPSVGSTAPEDSWGILSVASIINTSFPTPVTMFSRGTDGYIIGAITGITDFYVNGLRSALQQDFATGGTINLYTSATNYNPALPSSTNQAAVLAGLALNPLYLSMNFMTGAGDGTYGAEYSAASYVSTFDSGTKRGGGGGFLEVTGGAAQTTYDTNTLDTYAGTKADAQFSVTLSPILSNDAGVGNWLVKSTSDVDGYAIPEPGSMALLGIGLIGLAAARRRKQQA